MSTENKWQEKVTKLLFESDLSEKETKYITDDLMVLFAQELQHARAKGRGDVCRNFKTMAEQCGDSDLVKVIDDFVKNNEVDLNP